jgi:DNA-binding transcriptional MerR regulator
MSEIAARRTEKSPAAFRTISEVADELDVPQHVLRFWESKFPQVRPMKRGGGRRYYRPEDVVLLRRIRQCLYQEGYTIRGVQRLLREGAIKLSGPRTEQPSPLALAPANDLIEREPLADELRHALEEVRDELVELRALLKRALR